jgi:hypothetical protein
VHHKPSSFIPSTPDSDYDDYEDYYYDYYYYDYDYDEYDCYDYDYMHTTCESDAILCRQMRQCIAASSRDSDRLCYM